MQINMPDSGTFLFISDHCHVIENVCSLSGSVLPSTSSMLTISSPVAGRHSPRLARPRSSCLVPQHLQTQANRAPDERSSDPGARRRDIPRTAEAAEAEWRLLHVKRGVQESFVCLAPLVAVQSTVHTHSDNSPTAEQANVMRRKSIFSTAASSAGPPAWARLELNHTCSCCC